MIENTAGSDVSPLAEPSIWASLSGSPFATTIRESTWAYPALETLHIIGLALVFGSILAYDLRVLGWGRTIPLRALGNHLLPWVWTGFLLNAVTGSLMFASDAAEFAANPAFQIKLLLLAAAGANAVAFQRRLAPALLDPAPHAAPMLAARLAAIASIGLWLAIITAGRMMAYTA